MTDSERIAQLDAKIARMNIALGRARGHYIIYMTTAEQEAVRRATANVERCPKSARLQGKLAAAQENLTLMEARARESFNTMTKLEEIWSA